MLKRRGTISRSGLVRTAHLGFSRKKKAVPLLRFFPLSSAFLFSSSSSLLHPLFYSTSFFSFSFFELLLEKKNSKKKPENPRKKKFQKKSRPFFFPFHVLSLSLISLPSSSLFFCAVSFFPRPRIASRTTYLSAAFYFIVCFLGAFCVFYCVSAVKESAGLVWFCLLLCSLCGGLVVNDCHHTYQKKRSHFLILMPRFILSLSCLCSQSSLVMVVVVMVGADQTRPLF